jgi:hypothetical protein
MSHATEGFWDKQENFQFYNPQNATIVITVITKFRDALKTLADQYPSFDDMMEHTGIGDALLDQANFMYCYDMLQSIDTGIDRKQYDAYVTLMELFRHLSYEFGVIWDSRAILIDPGEPIDWLVKNSLVLVQLDKNGE